MILLGVRCAALRHCSGGLAFYLRGAVVWRGCWMMYRWVDPTMATTRPHFADLDRRYREVDWIAEFQRLWAIFNHWLKQQTNRCTDRDCIEALKTEPLLATWINDTVTRSSYARAPDVAGGYGDSYPRFAANSELSFFFRAAERSQILEPRLAFPWRNGTDPRVRVINTVILSEHEFRALYEAHASVLSSEAGIVYSHTLHEILPALGVGSNGCCFYRIPQTTPTPSVAALGQLTLHHLNQDGRSARFLDLISVQAPTLFSSDVIETLYNLRNVAVHGELDFLNASDNAVARAGYDLLESLIRDIRSRW